MAWFSKTARKTRIKGDDLCSAIRQAVLGQASDLGGGVLKKRLNKNHASFHHCCQRRPVLGICLSFCKKDRANISEDELRSFRALAGLYARKTDADIAKEVHLKELVEICYAEESQIQE